MLMSASALFMGSLGLAGSFLPHEILERLGSAPSGALAILMQIMAALYLGFAMLNWMAKESLVGGIYNRPLVVGNTIHFVAAALALAKAAASQQMPWLIALAAIYALFAIAFAYVMFGSPVKVRPDNP